MINDKILAKVKYNDDYWLEFITGFNVIPELKCANDIQVFLVNKDGKRLDDAICHYGSYGVDGGLWEIMSESLPKKHGDSVMGHLNWKQVEKYFDKTIKKREAKNNGTL